MHVRGALHKAGTTDIIAARVKVWCSIVACLVDCHMQCIGKLDFLEILLLFLALPICALATNIQAFTYMVSVFY